MGLTGGLCGQEACESVLTPAIPRQKLRSLLRSRRGSIVGVAVQKVRQDLDWRKACS